MNNIVKTRWYKKRRYTVILGSFLLIAIMVFTGIFVTNVEIVDARSLQNVEKYIDDSKMVFLLWRLFFYFLIVAFMFYRFTDIKLSELDEKVQKKIRSYKLRMPAYIVFFELIVVQNLASKLMGMN